ncbi:hypothetical protein pb186bvf_020727 [Paramecium bursaria]
MGCIEFWAVNSMIGSIMFFIIFLIVEGQPHFYKYPLTHKGDSATALILASIGYAGIGILLTLWYFFRQRRLNMAKNYQPAQQSAPQPRSTVLRAVKQDNL